MTRTQREKRRDPRARRFGAEGPHQDLLIGSRINDRRIADGIDTSGKSGVDLPERDFIGDADRGFETRAAGTLQIEGGGVWVERRAKHAFTREVEVARVLDHGARRHLAEPQAIETVFADDGLQRRSEHLQGTDTRVDSVRPCEGNARAADDGDAANCTPYQHGAALNAPFRP